MLLQALIRNNQNKGVLTGICDINRGPCGSCAAQQRIQIRPRDQGEHAGHLNDVWLKECMIMRDPVQEES